MSQSVSFSHVFPWRNVDHDQAKLSQGKTALPCFIHAGIWWSQHAAVQTFYIYIDWYVLLNRCQRPKCVKKTPLSRVPCSKTSPLLQQQRCSPTNSLFCTFLLPFSMKSKRYSQNLADDGRAFLWLMTVENNMFLITDVIRGWALLLDLWPIDRGQTRIGLPSHLISF